MGADNALEVLAQRGHPPDTAKLARRYIAGQIAPNEMLPAMMRLGRAYCQHLGPMQLARDLALGLRMKLRPGAFIFGFGPLLQGRTVMDRLSEIKVPTLVVAGRDDFESPPERQAALAEGIPNARLEIIEREGHNAPTERPAEVIEAVRQFLAAANVTPGRQSSR